MVIKEQHSRRRRKHSHKERNTPLIDRLSDLPDLVLCHILSFLRTKYSVRTSILGKRWRYLWAYVPTLDFYSEDEKIINRVMLLRKVQNIHTFRLLHDYDCDPYQLETWLTFAIMRDVQKLDLCLQDEDVLPSLPGCLFTCETLVDLRLENCGDIPVSGALCLPRLKILHLIFAQYESDESLPHILSGCPVLEELEIRLHMDMVYCDVSSLTIKRLVLDFIYEGCGGRSDRLEINTPALEYLQINHFSCEHIKSGVLTSLIKAEIMFCDDEGKKNYYLYSRSLLEFFDRLYEVKFLTLDFSYCPEIVDSLLSAWTISFRKLTKLELTCAWRFLSKLLASADNLEILIFTEHCEEMEEMEGWTEPPPQVPTCLLSHLRFIKIGKFQGENHEFETIRYLLRNSKVLDQMKISYSRLLSSNKEINMLKKISLFERGSIACKVAFVH